MPPEKLRRPGKPCKPAPPDAKHLAEATPEGLLRPTVRPPVEIYTPERQREFDPVEAELAQVFTHKAVPIFKRVSAAKRCSSAEKGQRGGECSLSMLRGQARWMDERALDTPAKLVEAALLTLWANAWSQLATRSTRY